MTILVVDDECAVRDAYRYALESNHVGAAEKELRSLADELFESCGDDTPDAANDVELDVEYFSQGLDAVAAVQQRQSGNDRYKVAFIDVRMPPGIDGKQTAQEIRQLDPDINLVIVTGYSDHSIADITSVAGPAEKIMYLQKPFVADEVRQMAVSLSARWDSETRKTKELSETTRAAEDSEERVKTAFHLDFLTGAPNRLSFQDELERRLTDNQTTLTLLRLDLDGFRYVNETHGNSAGDEVLRKVYTILCETFPDGTFVARLGEDEFGVLVDAEPQAAIGICRSGLASCQRTLSIFDSQIDVCASAGAVAADKMDGSCALDLLNYAQIALDNAKENNRGQLCVFEAEMKSEALFRQRIKKDLAKAIKDDELSVHYQPIVCQDTLKIVGFEALVRWTSAKHGVISPADFVPVAEEGPLIYELGEWILRQALHDCKKWPEYYLSINVSPRQFRGIDLKELFVRCADEAGVPYSRVQIEVTETAVFDDPIHSCEVLKSLQLLGFRIALDDFGTGFSNLSRVKHLALDCIKIDKSFVEDLGPERNATAIVSLITHLAHSLGLTVVAEGVENAEQFDKLRSVGCSHMQGYLFGPAEPFSEINARIARDETNYENQLQLAALKRTG